MTIMMMKVYGLIWYSKKMLGLICLFLDKPISQRFWEKINSLFVYYLSNKYYHQYIYLFICFFCVTIYITSYVIIVLSLFRLNKSKSTVADIMNLITLSFIVLHSFISIEVKITEFLCIKVWYIEAQAFEWNLDEPYLTTTPKI